MSENTLKPAGNGVPVVLAFKAIDLAHEDPYQMAVKVSNIDAYIEATRPTPDTGIGQGQAVKLAIDALEYHAAAYHRTFKGDNDEIMVEYHICNECLERIDGPSPIGLPHDKDCSTMQALAALKASPSSAPAFKQEACPKCEGKGCIHPDPNHCLKCEACGGSGKDSKC